SKHSRGRLHGRAPGRRSDYEMTLRQFSAIILFHLATVAQSSTVNLAWDASPDPRVVGYSVHCGRASANNTASVNVGQVTTWAMTGLVDGFLYYFVVQAYAADGQFSGFSNEVAATSGTTVPPTGGPCDALVRNY